MADRKIKKEDIEKLLKRSEFWVGAATVVVVLVLLGRLHIVRRMQEYMANRQVAPTAAIQNVTGTPEEQAAMTHEEPQQDNKLKNIKMLADTAGVVKVVVQKNDNFWNISKRTCGTGRYYLAIQEQNGNPALQPGDVVVVTCSE